MNLTSLTLERVSNLRQGVNVLHQPHQEHCGDDVRTFGRTFVNRGLDVPHGSAYVRLTAIWSGASPKPRIGSKARPTVQYDTSFGANVGALQYGQFKRPW